jgi:hypothetical protein
LDAGGIFSSDLPPLPAEKKGKNRPGKAVTVSES